MKTLNWYLERKRENMWGIIIAIISGALMSIQGVFNTGVTKQTSLWTAATFVQFSALLVCLAAWFFNGKDVGFMELFKIDRKYLLLGGAIGAFITITVVQSMKQLGPARAAIFIVTAQILVAYLIELFGLFGSEKVPFEWRKIIGIIIVIGGIITFKWK